MSSFLFCRRLFEYRWEYLKMPYTSSFLFVEGSSNIEWQYLKTSFMSLFLFVEGSSNINENTWSILCITSFLFIEGSLNIEWEYLKYTMYNFVSVYRRWLEPNETTWRHRTCPQFSLSKVVRISNENTGIILCISSFLFIEGDSNRMRIPDDIVHVLVSPFPTVIWMSMRIPEDIKTCHRFSLSKVIRIPMRLPEDIIHVLVSLFRWLFECRWEYRKTSYMSSFLFVEGYSNADENTWRHHTCSRFTLSKVIRMRMRIPEDIIHVLVSLFRRLFECR